MFNLILKDFRALFGYQLAMGGAIFLITLLTLVLLLDDGRQVIGPVFVGIAFVLCAASGLLFLRTDDAFKTDQIFASLPVNRAEIVVARYVTAFAQMAVGVLLVVAAIPLAEFMQENFGDPVLTVFRSGPGMVLLFIGLMLSTSTLLPFVFKFGFNAGVVAASLTQLGLLALVVAANAVLSAMAGNGTFDPAVIQRILEGALNWLKTAPNELVLTILFAAFVIIISASLGLSVAFYQRKDI